MTGYVGCGSGIAGWVLASLDFFASVFYQGVCSKKVNIRNLRELANKLHFTKV